MLGESKLDSHFTGPGVAEPEKTLDLALRLQPGTRHVVVTGGVGQFDRDVEAIVRELQQVQIDSGDYLSHRPCHAGSP
jgi:hypothetical protein